ncbi:MAG: cytochrome c oxidase accessory protein CcoG [Steroidobacteraceae bacterium]
MTVQQQHDRPDALYAAQQKIYPREVPGRFRNLRTAATLILLGVFYGLAWVPWHGRQAVLFDLAARKFRIFDLTFLPQDFFFLTWLLILAALSLFFFTAVAGRLWCGYACPQTVWTDAFVWMERITEGNRQQRMKLDNAPWSINKLWRKSAKQVLWLSFGLFTGYTFVGYFTPINELFGALTSFSAGPWETFWVLFYGFATYGNAGYLREQVCKYMCPYARFQSAMFDKDTLIISYDTERGEPRGSRARGMEYKAQGLGDCLDCTLCVQACPTGIDIRQGLQYECIACAACIDACDSVMDKMNYPRGLVRYSTQAAVEGSSPHVIRPRIMIYGALLAALTIGFFYAITHRSLVELDVLRDRNAMYRETVDGLIENVYTLRIINKDSKAHAYQLHVSGVPEAMLVMDQATLQVPASEVISITLRVVAPALDEGGAHPITFSIDSSDQGKLHTSSESRFFSPL